MAKTGPDIRFLAALVLLILTFTPVIDAHSGVERLLRIASNGTAIGPEGFPRGFWPRDAPGYQDSNNYHLVPPNGDRDKIILPTDPLAHNFQQTSNYSNPKYPPLKAAPGDMVVLQYQENGHTSLPQNQINKPLNRGTVYIYGTADLKAGTNLLDVHYKWNEQGTGGDGKGKLIATRNFDDGRCHENNPGTIATQRKAQYPKDAELPMGSNLWCQNDVALPADLPVDKPYTLIWIWDWPTMTQPDVATPPSSVKGAPPAPNGATVYIPELYITVMDINIVDPCDDALGEFKGPTCTKGGNAARQKYVVQEKDYNKAAIQDQLSNMFLVDVSALFDTGNTNNPATPESSSNPSSPTGSGSSSICTKSGDPKVKTTTLTSGGTVTTASPSGNQGAHISTTTRTASVIVTTATVIVTPSSSPTTAPAMVTLTVTEYGTTTTVTEIDPPSSSASVSKIQSTLTTSLTVATTTSVITTPTTLTTSGGGGGGKLPSVTRFMTDGKPTTTTTAVNNRRRAVGEWNFGFVDGQGV